MGTELQPYQQRVVAEEAELGARLSLLRSFMEGDRFRTLDSAEKSRLRRQEAAMTAYRDALAERIAAFGA